jgi:hypothetical protein
MFETIRISPYNNAALLALVSRLIAIGLLATLCSFLDPAVWAAQFEKSDVAKALPAQFENSDIAEALSNSPIVPPEAQDLTRNFLDYTLPKLLTDDDRLARQLGFGDSMNNTVILDRALPLMLISRNDVLKFVRGELKPLDLVNNTNNWMKDPAGTGKLVSKRIVFLLKATSNTSKAGSYSRSSVTVEHSQEGSWRIIQFGAPKLSRAMRDFESTGANHFLLWIPDLNRHYLGQIRPGGSDRANLPIKLTVLFDDQLFLGDLHVSRKAGESIDDATSPEFVEYLKRLYQALELPKKLRGQSGQNGQKQPLIKAK